MDKEEKKKFYEKMTGGKMSGEPPTDHIEAHMFEFDATKSEMLVVALSEAARIIKPTNEETLVACMVIARLCMGLIVGKDQGIDIEVFNIRQVLAMLDEEGIKARLHKRS